MLSNITLSLIFTIGYVLLMLYNLCCTVEYVILTEPLINGPAEHFAVLNYTDSPSTVEGNSSVKEGYHVLLSSTGGEGSNSNTSITGSGHSSAVNGYPGTASADPGSPQPGSASPAPSTGSSDVSMGSTDSGYPEHHEERIARHIELEQLEETKEDLKSLLAATEARDAGGNLTEDQQNKLNDSVNPSSNQVRETLSACRNRILDIGYDMGEVFSDSEDDSVSDTSDVFPGENEDNNNNQ
jgi:hypothetical protein